MKIQMSSVESVVIPWVRVRHKVHYDVLRKDQTLSIPLTSPRDKVNGHFDVRAYHINHMPAALRLKFRTLIYDENNLSR